MSENCGRPKGATANKRKLTEIALSAAKNQIADIYSLVEKKAKHKKKIVKKGIMASIIKKVLEEKNLTGQVITTESIKKRITRNNLLVFNKQGQISPLLPLEPKIVDIIVHMSRICQCLTPSQGLNLVNSVIKGTETQKALIKWKRINSCSTNEEALGQVGSGYWRNFIKRHGHNLCSKKGQKFELDRSSWSIRKLQPHVQQDRGGDGRCWCCRTSSRTFVDGS